METKESPNIVLKVREAQVLRNYRNFLSRLEKVNPNNADIVFIMVDLDHFKVVNDTHGHAIGGQVLNQMRQHSTFAADLLYPIEFLASALEIPFSHHEKWDGTGYPQGLNGEEIPLAARIFAFIDVRDALTHDRPYRPALTKPRALEHIRDQSGKHFDPRVVEEFVALSSDRLICQKPF